MLFNAVEGQSLIDVCLNTYGSLDYMYKLLQDNAVENIDGDVVSGQAFVWDDSLVFNQAVNSWFIYRGRKFATDIKKTLTPDETFLSTESGVFITTEDGELIKIEL